MTHMYNRSASTSREQIAEAYLRVLHLIDDRVTPFLGKVTTRVLVQGAAKRVSITYPFVHFLSTMPYTDVVPAVVHEQLSGVTSTELADGLDALLQECFTGLQELTGDLIEPHIHDEVILQLQQPQQPQ
jgi:hypothetical protein